MEQFTTAASTILNGSITSGSTSLTVLSATNFPTYAYFRIRVESEIMIVTAVSSTTFTITRGAEGTTAAAHNSGVQVVHIVTAQSLASSNWNIAFDLDLTALTTATYGTDGTFTFTGAPAAYNYTWTKGNSANEATHANIVNGSGLNFQPASTSDYNGATRTFPYVWLPFAQVFPAASFPNFGWNTKLRMWIAMGTDNLTATYDNYVFGMDSNSTGFGVILKRGYGTVGPQGSQQLFDVNGLNGNNFMTDTYTLGAGNKTYMVEFESVAAMWYKSWRGTGLSAGTPFPNASTLTAATYNQFGQAPNTSGGQIIFANTTVTDPLNGMGLFLGCQRAGSGTSLSVFYLRLRLDYKFQD